MLPLLFVHVLWNIEWNCSLFSSSILVKVWKARVLVNGLHCHADERKALARYLCVVQYLQKPISFCETVLRYVTLRNHVSSCCTLQLDCGSCMDVKDQLRFPHIKIGFCFCFQARQNGGQTIACSNLNSKTVDRLILWQWRVEIKRNTRFFFFLICKYIFIDIVIFESKKKRKVYAYILCAQYDVILLGLQHANGLQWILRYIY